VALLRHADSTVGVAAEHPGCVVSRHSIYCCVVQTLMN